MRDKAYVIAEIGGNFTDVDTALRLIDDAKWSGVDAVKLQTFQAKTITVESAMFEMDATGKIPQYEYFKQYEIDEETHKSIFDHAKEVGLDVFSTPSHHLDVEMLERIGVDKYKVGADDLTNIPLLKEIAALGKPILLSTGMSTMREIHEAVDAILEEGNSDITIMHVVSLYPTRPEFVNLNVIRSLREEFPRFEIGYSDHTMTTDACLFAAVMGAEVIEKHFTYDKSAEGPDHMHSATKEEMKELVNGIRLFEKMKGNGIKMPVSDELKNRVNNRKSLVYARNIESGAVLGLEDVDIKRPGTGIEPVFLSEVLGKRLSHAVSYDELVSWSDF